MAGRPSESLREEFEVAKRNAALYGTTTSVEEVRAKAALAVRITKDRLRPIENALAHNDIPWLVRTFPDWNAERVLLRNEVRELERLLDDLDRFPKTPPA